MRTIHKIGAAAAALTLLLTGCSAGDDGATQDDAAQSESSDDQVAPSDDQNESDDGGTANADELCAEIMAPVSWLEGVGPGPAELDDSASAGLGDFTQLRCTFGDGSVGGVIVTMHPDAFGDQEDDPSNEPYEGTDLKPAYVRNNGSQVHVRSEQGFDISMDVSAFIDGASEIRSVAEVNELANAVNDVVSGVA